MYLSEKSNNKKVKIGLATGKPFLGMNTTTMRYSPLTELNYAAILRRGGSRQAVSVLLKSKLTRIAQSINIWVPP